MTVYEAVYSVWRLPLLGGLFLLLTGQMAAVIAVFRDGRSRRAKLCHLAPFILGAAVIGLSMTVISWENNFPDGIREPPVWLASFRGSPAWTLAPAEVFLAVLLALSCRDIRRYRNEHLTPDSVKQAMDLLPAGIAFAQPDGAVLFRNLVMDRLSVSLTGKLLTDLTAFRTAAGTEPVSLEGRVWQINDRETPDSPLSQLTATDITEQAGVVADLEANNRKLKDIRLRLEIYNRQAERIIIAQELLTARMTVHDELGSVLLESRHYMNDPASIDEGLLLQALKNANTYLLREYEKDDTAVDPLADAFSAAEAIGVQVTLSGIPPAEESPRLILAAAIRECAANAVKHAGGDRLEVDARHTGEGSRFTLQSNGKPPAGAIRENGGLLSLRTLAEKQHGVMRIDALPEFRLTIMLPQKENGPFGP